MDFVMENSSKSMGNHDFLIRCVALLRKNEQEVIEKWTAKRNSSYNGHVTLPTYSALNI
jgi:hypothetical protein